MVLWAFRAWADEEGRDISQRRGARACDGPIPDACEHLEGPSIYGVSTYARHWDTTLGMSWRGGPLSDETAEPRESRNLVQVT